MKKDISYPCSDSDEPEAPMIVLILYIIAAILVFMLMYRLVVAIYSNRGDQGLGEGGNNIQVSATVLPTLSFKYINSDVNSAITVSGNYQQGYTVNEARTGETIFTSDKVPGVGVLVKIPSSGALVTVLPNY